MFAPMKRLTRFLMLCGAVTLMGLNGSVRAETVVQTEQVRAEMTAEQTAVAPGESLWVALSLTIKPGWHTYWQTPGDAGAPPDIRWHLPEGVTAGPIQWPAPHRIATADLMSFGYSEHMTMLTELKVAPNVAPSDITLQADSTWYVCADVCIPEDGSFALPLKITPAGARTSTAAGAAIAAARAELPKPAPWPISLARSGKTLTLTAGPDVGADKFSEVAFFPVEDGVLANAAPQTAAIENRALRLTMATGATAPANVSGLLVLANGDARVGYTVAAAVTGSAGAANAEATSAVAVMPLAFALALAFLGGIILNIMPCVLPVLVMKAMSFISRGTDDAAALRRDGLAYIPPAS